MEDKLSKMGKRISLLKIIGVSLVLISFISFLINSNRQMDNLKEQQTIIEKKDSLIEDIRDSSLAVTSKQDSLIFLANTMIRLRQKHNVDSLQLLYADSLDVYFKNFRNVDKKKVAVSEKQYWRKFPEDNFIITESAQVFLMDSVNVVTMKGKGCREENKCIDVMLEIHFTRSNQINYVRAFFDK